VGEALLWIPRVILAPLYAINEYALRRPIYALIGSGERAHSMAYIERFFQPVPDFHWLPSAVVQSQMTSMFGAGFTWTNAFVPHNQVRVTAMTFGPGYVDAFGRVRYTAGNFHVGVRGGYYDRLDQPFYGLGPLTTAQDLMRYHFQRAHVFALLDWIPTEHLQLETQAGYNHDATGPGAAPSIAPAVEENAALAPGFGTLDVLNTRARVTVDSRSAYREATGLRLVLDGMAGFNALNTSQSFVVGSAELQGSLEVMHPGRVLVASVYVADSATLGGAPVPFTYLPALGGAQHVGFTPGRFVGQSAVLAELRYRYPVWAVVDAVWSTSVGNVFGQDFRGFDFADMTASFALGFSIHLERLLSPVEVLLALGTTRFDGPFAIEGFRVYFGINRGL
jgi:hypothetical protein